MRCTDGGAIHIGDGCHIDAGAYLVARSGVLTIGRCGFIGPGSVIVACEKISIGIDVLIAEYVTIRDQDHEFEATYPTRVSGMRTTPISIGDNVWIGAKVTLTKGIIIGDNSVIGANSVVTGDIAADEVAAGAPAKVIKHIKNERRKARQA